MRDEGGAIVRTLTAKILPPDTPPGYVARPKLEARLAEAMARRLTTIVAGAGFGKSTLLSAWSRDLRCAWYTLDRDDEALPTFARGLVDSLRVRLPGIPVDPLRAVEAASGPDADEAARADALAGAICQALDQELAEDVALVLDDVGEIAAGGPAARLIEGLARQAPSTFHLVLASRSDPPFPVSRLRGRGHVLELGPADLAFTPEEVGEFLAAALGRVDPSLADEVHTATEGWPAAVRLTVESVRERGHDGAVLQQLRRPGGPLYAYLAEEVLTREPPEVRDLVTRVAVLDRFTPELCEILGVAGAAETIRGLVRRGLFVEPRGTADGWYALNPLVRDVALERFPLEDREARTVFGRAGAWFEERGMLEEALRCADELGDEVSTARILGEQGNRLLAGGGVEAVLRARAMLPPELVTPGILQLDGQARLVRGDWEGALACFREAAADLDALPPGLAWRMGQIHHMRGELEEALAVYSNGATGRGEHRDDALLQAAMASVHWLRGEAEECRRMAHRAGVAAEASGDPQAQAAVYTARAMLAALEGDRRANDAFYLKALDAAERSGDVLQVIRIRVNRASRSNEEGDYRDALRELDVAIRLAELTGFALFLALGLNNRAESHFRLGALDRALTDLRAAQALYQRIGSRDVCYALSGIGDVYRERGDLALARAAYEEALAVAEGSRDLQGLVPPLTGLARVLAEEAPEEAGRLARRDRGGLAEALVLQALASPDPRDRLPDLEEAVGIWRDLGDLLRTAQAEVALGHVSGDRALVGRAEAVLRDLGVRLHARGAAGILSVAGRAEDAPVVVQALGGFRVLLAGQPVTLSAWQSKKARDLLKILVAKRGRPVPREFLMEALWPDEDPARLNNRLSVALTTVRSILDPDRRSPPERYIQADKDSVMLDSQDVEVDVERFRADASRGLRLQSQDPEAAERFLAAAESAYIGDFLEENAYDDWAAPLREEARATYISVARALAGIAVSRRDHDAAVRYLLRIVERDQYDEEAHLGLVAVLASSGSHGEARRHYRTYRARMEELGVEPAPFPSGGQASP